MLTKQLSVLQTNMNTNLARIDKTKQEKDALQSFTEDGEGQNLDEQVREMIDENTRKLYLVTKDVEAKPNDPEYNKLLSQNTLTMLNEIEYTINQYLETFDHFATEDN